MKEMRLLMSSASDPKYLAHQYYINIENKLGADNILGFYHNDQFNSYYTKTKWNKILYKLYPKYIETKIYKNLIEICESFKPTVVLIFKGMELRPKAVAYLKKNNIYLVNYNLDHPFEHFSKGSGNSNVIKALPLYNLHLTYSKKIEQDLKKKFHNCNVDILPFGYGLSDELYKRIDDEFDEICRICFIGNPDAIRTALITSFLNSGLEVDVYGIGWDKSGLEHQNLNIFEAAYNDDYWRIIRKYRVQLNVFRPHNYNSHNMRTFEVPAVGGIMLAPYSDEHASFFEDEKEVFYYKTEKEAIKLAKKLLELSKPEANFIRENARLRSVNSGYSYKARADQLIQILKNRTHE